MIREVNNLPRCLVCNRYVLSETGVICSHAYCASRIRQVWKLHDLLIRLADSAEFMAIDQTAITQDNQEERGKSL